MKKESRIYVAGHSGMVGSAIVKKLQSEGYTNIITRSHEYLDLTIPYEVKYFIKDNKPEYVFQCAAKVGGICANSTYPVDFLYENMMINMNVIKYAYENDVAKLMVLGSSCIYPKECEQPIKEEYLLSKALESTNEGYALAKISGIKLCQAYNKQYGTNYISVMPCSLLGEGDNFHPQNSHLIPAIMLKCHNAKINGDKEVEIWGSGKPLREFMYTEDVADGLLFLMNSYDKSEVINLGTGIEHSISEIAEIIKEVIGFKGEFRYNTDKPDGTMRKVLDCSKMKKLGWKPKIELKEGIKMLYDWYLSENS